MLLEKLIKAAAGSPKATVIESGGGRTINGGPGMQPEAAEQALLPICEVLIRQVKGSCYG